MYSATGGPRLGSATCPGLRPSRPWHKALPGSSSPSSLVSEVALIQPRLGLPKNPCPLPLGWAVRAKGPHALFCPVSPQEGRRAAAGGWDPRQRGLQDQHPSSGPPGPCTGKLQQANNTGKRIIRTASPLSLGPAYTIHMINGLRCFP